MNSKDRDCMKLAKSVALNSLSLSRVLGCVIYTEDDEISISSPKINIAGSEDHELCPERNAIYFAARRGIKLAGCTMYVTAVPCVECAKAIIQSGCVAVIVEGDNSLHEKLTVDEIDDMFADAEVEFRFIEEGE